jgi:ribosomal protein S18 acetylase RimI-like enzyme
MSEPTVRRATIDDVQAIGQLLHDFNVEYAEPTPTPDQLAARFAELLPAGDDLVLLADDPPAGIAVLRFRPSLWSRALECYLAELYVVPARRRQGLGLALMEAAMSTAREQGADYMDLGTAENDHAARALYERLGFSNREGKPNGPVNYYYEREL